MSEKEDTDDDSGAAQTEDDSGPKSEGEKTDDDGGEKEEKEDESGKEGDITEMDDKGDGETEEHEGETEHEGGENENSQDEDGEEEDEEEDHEQEKKPVKPKRKSTVIDYDKEMVILRDTLRCISVEDLQLKEDTKVFDPSDFPPSYLDNTKKEEAVLLYCRRFIKHYNHLFDRERRPLFIKPWNEFGVRKMVCTTICPTQLPYKDLMDWQDIANFLATYLVYKRLPSPTELPETLYAPQTVLSRKWGHCFEFSTLLCSMLIGSGYDAYVVSGYATREVTYQDCSFTKCPWVEDDIKVYPTPQILNIRKYTVRPPRWNRSEFLLRMKKKNDAALKEVRDMNERVMEMQRGLDEAPPDDELHGYRVHSWVLVLEDQRDIEKSFFIEPTTGVACSLTWEGYLGVETLWNHYNYYVNVQQDVPNTMEKLNWDIGDSRDWEYVFPGQDLHLTMTQSETRLDKQRLSATGDICGEEFTLDLPFSWALPLKLSRQEYDIRYPTGKAYRRYKRANVELFAEHLHPEGLVTKLRVYFDLEWKKLHYTREHFAHRSDLLEKRFTHHPSGKVIENYLDGREDFIKEHQYYVHTPGPETCRTFVFFNDRRTDAMYKREESPKFLKEWYDERPDRLLYREAVFGPDGLLLESGLWPEARPIEALIEEFSRNPAIPANKDIARVTFSVWLHEIDIEYHIEKERLYGSTRHFTKPDRWWDDSFYLDWKPDLHWNFEANIYVKPLSNLILFQMMVGLMDMEAKSRVIIRKSERESIHLLKARARDVAKLQLMRTHVDADIIPSNRVARLKEKARLKAELLLKKSDVLKDFLDPYLHRFGLHKVTNRKQAQRVMENLMADLKDRLFFAVNVIKTAYDEVKEEITKMQMIHSLDFSKKNMAEMEAYQDKLTLKLFMGQILGQRLIAFKNYAPIKYRALYEQIKSDPRMSPYM